MVRRVANLWPQIVSFENVMKAADRAALGKRDRASVARFMLEKESRCLEIIDELESGQYRPGVPSVFVIHDPKHRRISAAPFRDRVVHQALIAPLIPHFERRMIHRSYACRIGKGQHAALLEAQRQLRKFDYFLRMDVRHCFESLDHEVVLETLARVIKDQRVIDLCDVIVRASNGPGLPIGNLTSQWFANLVLGRLDHFVKDELGIPGYLRYMDDFVLFTSNKDRLRQARKEVEHFLQQPLKLEAKHKATLLAPAESGLPYLGWNIHRGTMRLRAQNLRRIRLRFRKDTRHIAEGKINEDEFATRYRALGAWMSTGSTLALRQRWRGWCQTPGSMKRGK
ncbi:MAG: RNA-directed DNA polymerase [Planctomycetota bacterium]|jgi:RNA-directed DNA polymerase